ncbi:MAG: tetratricopeptide repeat protein, partial [Rhodothermales bacterium]|nr:tetratricopeptide repeat protein [Rhodothermales bacterium]
MTRIGLIAALLAAVLAPPCASAQDSTAAIAYRDPGIRLLRSMVEANPDEKSYRIRLAGSLFEAGQYAEAAEHYAEYMEGVQVAPHIVRNYLFALTQTEGSLAAGERTASKYAEIYPTDAEILMRLGYFRLWQGKFSSALETCRRASTLDPVNEQIAECAEQAANPPTGIRGSSTIDRLTKELRSAGLVDSDRTEIRFRLAAELSKAGRYQEAWDHLLTLEPAYGTSARWLDAFLTVEKGLTRPDGSSPMYPIDRLTFLLRARPGDRELRLRLADALIEEQRFSEALGVLTAPGRLRLEDDAYGDRIRRIVDLREARALERIAELTGDPTGGATAPDDLTELTSHFMVLGRGREALETCERLTTAHPRDVDAGLYCMNVLSGLGYAGRAVAEADRLERLFPSDETVRRRTLIVRLESGRLDEAMHRRLDGLLTDPSDPELLLAAAGYHAGEGRMDRARALLDRLPPPDVTDPHASRRHTLEVLIDRETRRSDIEREHELLRDARRLAAAARDETGTVAGEVSGRYRDAVDAYERYFEARGVRTRPELLELAAVHAAAGDHRQALSILHALEDEFHDGDVLRLIARIRMDMGDAGGALAALDRLIAERPRDWEARLWRADVLAGLGYHEEALAIYDRVPEGTGTTYAVAQRRAIVVNEARGAGAAGDWSGLDYAGILAPNADGVRARGGGTTYDRWGQGMQTHVTTPIGLVVLAGIDSHFLSGTRRLVPDSETVAGRINRLWTGGIFD